MLIQIGRDLLLGKRMVAQRDDIRARGKNIVRLLWHDAAPCGVFTVDNDKIRPVFPFDAAQQAVQGIDPRLADHVANRQYFHCFTSCLFFAAAPQYHTEKCPSSGSLRLFPSPPASIPL